MRTPEQEALLRELLFILPDFAVEYRRMAKWLADENRRYEYGLNERRERAGEVISMVRRISVDHEAMSAEVERCSPLRGLLGWTHKRDHHKPKSKLRTTARLMNARADREYQESGPCPTTITSLSGPAIGPRLKNGSFFSHRSMK
jgi:hypothetical protein